MIKLFTLLLLIFAYCLYSGFVYTNGTEMEIPETDLIAAAKGKLIFQKYNCTACHQLYGLGGYLGPELTTMMSAPGKGKIYAKAILQKGTQRMPDLKLNDEEINSLIAYLAAVNASAVTYKTKTYGSAGAD